MTVYIDSPSTFNSGEAISVTFTSDVTPTTPIGMNARASLTIPGFRKIEAVDGSKLTKKPQLVFYMECDPMYATVDYILLKAGEMIGELPEHAIYIAGFVGSTQVQDILLFNVEQKFKNRKNTEQYKFFNRARVEYASCQAVLMLLRGIINERGTSATRKTLADFTIDRGALSNIFQSIRPYMKDLTEECMWWRSVLFAGGKADHHLPKPQSAVKAGSNTKSNAIGIGRGWAVGGSTLNTRTTALKSGDSWTRPVRTYEPRFYSTIKWA